LNARPLTLRTALAACLGLLLIAPTGALAGGTAAHRLPAGSAGHGARAYWTAKRIRSASPRPAVRRATAAPSAASPLAAPVGDAAAGTVDLTRTRPPRRTLAHPVGPGDDPPYQSGEVPLAAQTTYPTSTNGLLLGKFDGIGSYSCSASVVSSSSHNVILTAGHCVYDEKAGFAKKIAFVPAYHDGSRPFGTWIGRRETVARGWVRGNFNYDYAAIRLRSPAGTLGDAVGEKGLAWNQPRNQSFQAIGYPYNRGETELMWNCVAPFAGVDPYDRSSGKPDSGIGCDMGEGASGGGWTIRDDEDVPYVNSVTSFGYSRIDDVLFGPYLTRKVLKVVNRANR
jgi:hypothetical protein